MGSHQVLHSERTYRLVAGAVSCRELPKGTCAGAFGFPYLNLFSFQLVELMIKGL